MEQRAQKSTCHNNYSRDIINCCDALTDVGDHIALLSSVNMTRYTSSIRATQVYCKQMNDIINRLDNVTAQLSKLLIDT